MKKNKRALLLLSLLLVTLTNSRAQAPTSLAPLPSSALLLADTQRMDSVMHWLEWHFGSRKFWRFRVDDLDDVPSVVILKQNTSAKFNPNMLKSSAPILVNQGSSSPFSWRDNMMWGRDFNWSHFASAFLFGH